MKVNFRKNCAYIIAEIGNNHEGSFVRAKNLIKLAAKSGANAVKFQTFKVNNFVKNKDKIKSLKKFELSYEHFEKLRQFAHKNNLNFISTPLDIESANFLGKIADAIKISSGDNNFLELIKICLKYKKPILISLGLLNNKDTDKQTKKIYNLFLKNRILKNLNFLHCVSSYPVSYKNANLMRIKKLKKKWKKIRIGYSDHTLGIEACLAARVIGATIIEKHFTSNKKFSNFRDHALSANYNEMRQIVNQIRNIEKMINFFSKNISNEEKKGIKAVRRQPYAIKEIKKHELINLRNVRFMRPDIPTKPIDIEHFIGKRANKLIKKEKILKRSDVV